MVYTTVLMSRSNTGPGPGLRFKICWTWTWGPGPGSAKRGRTGPGPDLGQSIYGWKSVTCPRSCQEWPPVKNTLYFPIYSPELGAIKLWTVKFLAGKCCWIWDARLLLHDWGGQHVTGHTPSGLNVCPIIILYHAFLYYFIPCLPLVII